MEFEEQWADLQVCSLAKFRGDEEARKLIMMGKVDRVLGENLQVVLWHSCIAQRSSDPLFSFTLPYTRARTAEGMNQPTQEMLTLLSKRWSGRRLWWPQVASGLATCPLSYHLLIRATKWTSKPASALHLFAVVVSDRRSLNHICGTYIFVAASRHPCPTVRR